MFFGCRRCLYHLKNCISLSAYFWDNEMSNWYRSPPMISCPWRLGRQNCSKLKQQNGNDMGKATTRYAKKETCAEMSQKHRTWKTTNFQRCFESKFWPSCHGRLTFLGFRCFSSQFAARFQYSIGCSLKALMEKKKAFGRRRQATDGSSACGLRSGLHLLFVHHLNARQVEVEETMRLSDPQVGLPSWTCTWKVSRWVCWCSTHVC